MPRGNVMRAHLIQSKIILPALALLAAAGCDQVWPLDKVLVCGDGLVAQEETCDGVNLGGQECVSQGFEGGALACKPGCKAFDTKGCYRCGDSALNGQELCDGKELGNKACNTQGFRGGTLKCGSDCQSFDTSACYKCGDGKMDGDKVEVCDGADLDNKTCVDQGFVGGILRCAKDCKSFDSTSCYKCGDNALDKGEVCDGKALGGLTCASGGYDGGALACKNDCSGADASHCYTWDMVVSSGGTGWDAGRGVALDSEGNSYIVGHFSGTATFGATTLTSKGGSDVFVAKVDPGGAYVWAKSFGNTESDIGYGVAVDTKGGVYITGTFEKSISFGGTPSPSNGGGDVFVAKLDSSNGNPKWFSTFGGAKSNNDDVGRGIAVDSAGNYYVVGRFSGSITLAGKTVTADNSSAFVVKFNSAGTPQWIFASSSTSSPDYGYGIAVDGAGNSTITGTFNSTVSFGVTVLKATGSQDIYVAKLDSAGKALWAASYGGSSLDYGYAIAVDGQGNSYTTGSFSGSATFGSTTLTASDGDGDSEAFVVKHDPQGKILWARSYGGPATDRGQGINLGSNGQVYFTGLIYKPAAFGTYHLKCPHTSNIFVARLDKDGHVIWAAAPIITSGSGNGIAVDDTGSAHVVGQYTVSGLFGTEIRTSKGNSDLVLFRIQSGVHFFTDISPATTAYISSLWSISPSDVYATDRKSLLHYDGAAWSTVSLPGSRSPSLKDIWATGPSDVFVAGDHFPGWSPGGYRGIVYHFDGATWSISTEHKQDDPGNLYLLWGTGPTNVWAIGRHSWGSVHYCVAERYDGKTWSSQKIIPQSSCGIPPRAIWGNSDSDLYLLSGSCGKYGCTMWNYHYDGTTWTEESYIKSQSKNWISDVWGSGSTDVYVVGYGGQVYHRKASGWATKDMPHKYDFYSIWGSGAKDIYMVGAKGKMVHFDGSRWITVPLPTTMGLYDIHGDSKGNVFVSGESGTVLRKH